MRRGLLALILLQAFLVAAQQPTGAPASSRQPESGRPAPPDTGRTAPIPPSDLRVFPARPGGELQRRPELPPLQPGPLVQPMTGADAEPLELLVLDPTLEQAQARQAALQSAGLRLIRRALLAGVGGVLSTYRAPDAMRYQQHAAAGALTVPNHRYELMDGSVASDAAGHENLARRLRQQVAWPPEGACRSAPRIGMIDTPVEVGHVALLGSHIETVSLLPVGLRAADAEHGTAVASVLVGQRATPALLPRAQLLAVSVFVQTEGRVYTTAELVIRGVDRLILARVDAINFSFGGPGNRLLEQVLRRARQLGVPLVAAAGNGGPQAPATYPAAYDSVLAVVAVDLSGRPDARASRGEHLDFAAPGVDIPVARLRGGLTYRSGSSYAAPFVAAMLAAGISESQLREAAEDLGEPGRDAVFGWGLARGRGPCDVKAGS